MNGLLNVNAYIYGEGIKKVNIGFNDGKICFIGNDKNNIKPICDIPTDAIVVPGFIDEHIHGAGGYDVMDATINALDNISLYLAKEGTTSFLATTMTQSHSKLLNALYTIKEYIKNNNTFGSRLIGAHLEGPFISAKHIGAQPLEYIQKPFIEGFKVYNLASGNNIKIVTLAPEEENGLSLVKCLKNEKVVASIGHSDAKYVDVENAIKAGAKSIAHTFNAQTGFHHREIGVVGSALLFDELNCEIICDCIHVSIPALKLIFKNKPKDKITLITDSMRAKGLPYSESELGGQKVFIKDGKATLADGTLAGSILRMNVAIKNIIEKCDIPFTDAIDCATANPAKNIGIFDKYGSISLGKFADFTVLDKNFNVLLTIVGGNIVFKAK